MILLPKLQVLQRSFLHTDAILATPEMSTLDAMEELAFQIRTQQEITATLLKTWSNDLTIVQKDFKSVFDKLSHLQTFLSNSYMFLLMQM